MLSSDTRVTSAALPPSLQIPAPVLAADPPRRREGYVPRPGVYALRLRDGERLWSLPVDRNCEFDPANVPQVGLTAMRDAGPANPWPACSFYYGHSAAPLYANGLVYAGALDGKLRIIDATTGCCLSFTLKLTEPASVRGFQSFSLDHDRGASIIACNFYLVHAINKRRLPGISHP